MASVFDVAKYILHEIGTVDVYKRQEQDTVETIQTRFHAMEQRGLTRRDIDALYDLLQDVVGDEERAIEDNLADMRVVLDEWGEGYVA